MTWPVTPSGGRGERRHFMQYRTLGRTGVQVSTLVLGAMNFGSMGRTAQQEVTAIVDAALDGGVNLIDTADMYSRGESEQLVGRAIAGRRDDVVLAVVVWVLNPFAALLLVPALHTWLWLAQPGARAHRWSMALLLVKAIQLATAGHS